MREIVLDTETTGLSTKDGHRIFEIGAVELVNFLPTGEVFHHFVNPGRELSAESTRITGITDEQVKDKPPFADVVDDFLAFLGDAPIIAHNANFDISFLSYELEILSKPALANQIIDTLALARKKIPGGRHSLDALCKRFNITRHEERTTHGALLDAQLLADVYVELTGGLQGALELETTITTTTTITSSQTGTLKRPPLIIEPGPEEAQNHAHMMAKLKN
jgi:DNA polymerase-3 subunit epsilon